MPGMAWEEDTMCMAGVGATTNGETLAHMYSYVFFVHLTLWPNISWDMAPLASFLSSWKWTNFGLHKNRWAKKRAENTFSLQFEAVCPLWSLHPYQFEHVEKDTCMAWCHPHLNAVWDFSAISLRSQVIKAWAQFAMLHPLGEILCAGAGILQSILLYLAGSFVKLLGILSALRSQLGSHLCQSTPKPQRLLPWESQVEHIHGDVSMYLSTVSISTYIFSMDEWMVGWLDR